MSTPNSVNSGTGFRNCVIFELEDSGAIAGLPLVSTTGSAGISSGNVITAPRTLTVTDPEPEPITHYGGDAVLAIDYLPSQESMTGELMAAAEDFDIEALVAGINEYTEGERIMVGAGTDKRGDAVQVGLMAYRQALDTSPDGTGLRRWEFMIMPKAFLIPQVSGFDVTNTSSYEKTYTVRPQVVTKHIWGTAFSSGSAGEGFNTAQVIRGVSQYKPKIVAFKSNGTHLNYYFPTDYQAVNTDKITVWVNGVKQTSGITLATNKITFDAAPAENAVIVVFYEVE